MKPNSQMTLAAKLNDLKSASTPVSKKELTATAKLNILKSSLQMFVLKNLPEPQTQQDKICFIPSIHY